MSEQNTPTLSDNELIAQFMGIKVAFWGPVLYQADEDGMVDLVNAETYWPDRDWNLLINAVKEFKKRATHSSIPYALWMNVISFSVDRPIVELHEHIVKAIKWLNEHESSKGTNIAKE